MKFDELRNELREARINLNRSQLDVARKSKRQRPAVADFEKGERGHRTRVDTVEAIAEALGFHVEYDLVPIEDQE